MVMLVLRLKGGFQQCQLFFTKSALKHRTF
uniref:Uncharacterized protein n=1 Tax=Arundo donax TaxID=35708 RepID=A0A0A9BLN0_ARUDO